MVAGQGTRCRGLFAHPLKGGPAAHASTHAVVQKKHDTAVEHTSRVRVQMAAHSCSPTCAAPDQWSPSSAKGVGMVVLKCLDRMWSTYSDSTEVCCTWGGGVAQGKEGGWVYLHNNHV
jgi:hypothetical protein